MFTTLLVPLLIIDIKRMLLKNVGKCKEPKMLK
jgi:hypothetical protein